MTQVARANIYALLATSLELEMVSEKRMTSMATKMEMGPVRSRLMVLAAFSRAHASRLRARLVTMRPLLLPVVLDEEVPDTDLVYQLELEAGLALKSAKRYGELTELSRTNGDLSTSWVCQLNGTEEKDRVRELLKLAKTVKEGGGKRDGPLGETVGIFLDELSTPAPRVKSKSQKERE